jgi:hypothetical protein
MEMALLLQGIRVRPRIPGSDVARIPPRPGGGRTGPALSNSAPVTAP